jgi:magnesium-transporting ATPase (P-type)
MDKNINESLVGQSDTGSYKYNADELATICNLDNHHKDENSEFPTRTISSGLIIEKYHGLNDIMKSLGCDPVKGIVGTKADTDERKRVFGPNFFPPPHIKSLYELVMENFDDKINLVLLAAAGVSLAIGLLKEGFPEGMIEGSSICIALVIIIVVNSGNNYTSERRLADLVKLADKQ